jgi:quinol-cytochrome oxidoreductase complex cytochrome b subunit
MMMTIQPPDAPDPVDRRTDSKRKRRIFQSLVLHFRPATVPEKTLRLTLSWGLGGAAAVLVFLQIGTGVLLKFVYEPTPVAAYRSVQALISDFPFGRLIRNLHHWSAHLLQAVLLLHMLRVFFSGGFHGPRRFNWIIGLALLAIVSTANFTGYLLPWDQLSYWAVTVAMGMLEYFPVIGTPLQTIFRGGADVGPGTLRIFYALHTAVVPVGLGALMALHFWRVRKAGGLVLPRSLDDELILGKVRVPALPHLFLREATAAAVLIAAILLWSVLIDAPLGDPSNPGLSPNPTKSPWYFAGFQELLMHLHPGLAAWGILMVLGVALPAIPYLNYETETGGVWFVSRTGRRTAGLAFISALVLIPALIVADEWSVATGRHTPGIATLFDNPFFKPCCLTACVLVSVGFLKHRYAASRLEIVQALFVFLVTAFALMTATCVWFRQEGMALSFPW